MKIAGLRSIRAQFFLFVAAIVLPIAGLYTWMLATDAQQLREAAQDRVRILADGAAEGLQRRLVEAETVLGRIAARPLVRRLDPQDCDQVVIDFVSLNPRFTTLAVRDLQGRAVCSYLPNPIAQLNAEEFPWFAAAVRSTTFTAGDAFLGRQTGRWVSVLTHPIFDDAQALAGVLVMPFDLLKLSDDLLGSIPAGARVIVVDRNGRVMMRSAEAAAFVGKPAASLGAEALGGEEFVAAAGLDGVRRLYAVTPLTEYGWRVVAGIPESEVYADYYAVLWRSLSAGLAMLLLIGVLAWRFGASIVRPIAALAQAASRAAAGDAGVRTTPAGPAEVRAVADQFNRLLDARERNEQALRESEERYRALVEWSPEAIVVHRGERIVYANPAAVALFGARSAEELVATNSYLDLVHPEHRATVLERVSTIRERGIIGSRAELKLLRRDGATIDVAVQGVKIVYDGEPAICVALRDITEMKQAEAGRASLEAQLREAQKMEAIGTLAGGIAHEFSNIVATVLGNARLARADAGLNPLAVESLEEIAKAGERGRELVQQILSFSRRQPVERKPIALAPVVEESIRLLRATLPARVGVQFRCDPGVPAVLANASQIQQVLINLATNAMQAMQDRPGRIDIGLNLVALDAPLIERHPTLHSLGERSAGGQVVRLSVTDDGPGMDAATLDRVFEPFFTTKQVDEGSGLGLAVVHGIAKSHDGEIVVHSSPGRGATFSLFLPVAVAGAERPPPRASGNLPPPQQAAGASASPAAFPRRAGRRILLVDDDESLLYLATRLLERQGFEVSDFPSGEDALAALRADPSGFDLLVSDYNMPGMSGLDLARKARALRADLPVVVVSGFIDEKLREQAGAAGVWELVFKADTVEDFCDALQRLARSVGGAPKPGGESADADGQPERTPAGE